MHSLKHAAFCCGLLVSGACATAPAPPLRTTLDPADSVGTVWGDEYDGPMEAPEPVRASRGLNAEWVDGATRSARLDAHADGASLRVRSSPRGDVGSIAWRGPGPLCEIAVGHVAPAVAEGALVGDARASADLRAPTSAHSGGLRMEPSASPWAGSRGAGVVCAAGMFRVGLGGCEARDDPSRRLGFASVERHGGGVIVGAAAGASIDPAPSRGSFSLYAAREDDTSFASGEVAVSQGRVRTIARVVAGERNEWSAIAVAGAGPAGDQPLAFSPRERWGAALERRDAWRWGANRAGVSSLTRRDDVTDVQRRRVFWDGTWRVSGSTRLELAARVTREASERRAEGSLAALPAHDTRDDWRARLTLRSSGAGGNGWSVDNAYRLEWVQNRSGRPGTVAAWTCRIRSGAWDGRISATAHALLPGQVAYEPTPAPLASGEYSALSGKGAAITASLRLWLRRHAWLDATWSRRPPAGALVWIGVGVRT